MVNVKNDFPIFRNNKGLVYLDSAATSQKPQSVIDAINNYYETYNSNIHRGIYPIAEKATQAVEDVRKKVARFINVQDPKEIILTHGTTEALNILASGFGTGMIDDVKILLSEMEHHSNLVPWQREAKRHKGEVLFLTIDNSGQLTRKIVNSNDQVMFNGFSELYHLEAVSLTHVSNVLGTINPISEIVEQLDDEVDMLMATIVVDAAQSVPHMPIDVQKIGCDYLVFSGHKMLGPTGVGVLYAKGGLDVEPLIVGSQMIREVTKGKVTFADAPARYEPGTMPIEAIIGLGAAIDYLEEIGMKKIREHEKNLTRYCLEEMQKIDGLQIYGPKDVEIRSGVISFNLQGIHPHDIAQVLGDEGICIRAGHHCTMPLHKRLGIAASCRASFYIYNEEEDVKKLIEGIKKVKKIFSL